MRAKKRLTFSLCCCAATAATLAAIVLPLSLVPVAATAAKASKAPTPKAIAGRVQQVYQKAGDLTADFTHTYTNALRGKQHIEKGKLWAKADGRVRWVYLEPRKDFIFDGKNASFYEPESAQVTVFEGFHDSQLAAAMGFLLGKGDLTGAFAVKSCTDTSVCTPTKNEWMISLVPKKPIPTVSQVLMGIDRKTSRVRRSIVLDPLGNRSAYQLSNVVFGAKVASTVFDFEVPDDVSVLRTSVGPDKPKQAAK